MRVAHSVVHRQFSTNKPTLGFVGLGHMGSKMVTNFSNDGQNLIVFDPNSENQIKLTSSLKNVSGASSAEEVATRADIIFTMLPNDEIVHSVSKQLLTNAATRSKPFLHISCSTTSPNMSRSLEKIHQEFGQQFVASPVFARPDGLLRREAIFMVSGNAASRQVATSYLSALGRIEDMGDEIGAANVVKLCGNFLIAVSRWRSVVSSFAH
jgi:3-hydroxyisobutyrate dehydrogenase-like beta-hydroxyacid dehydrogenase